MAIPVTKPTACRLLAAAAVVAGLCVPTLPPPAAQACTREDLANAVDQAGGALRQLARETQPRLDAKMRLLRDLKGWSEAEYVERAYAGVQDESLARLDTRANEQLERIDTLGAVAVNATPECRRLAELEAASGELQATIRARLQYLLTRFDQQIAEARGVPPPLPAAPPPAAPPAPKPSVIAAPLPLPPKAPDVGWSASTTLEREPPRDQTYSIEEIKLASTGFLGQVSTGLGGAVEYAFSNVGRPTGYILGSEGGGALIAGLRYGTGTLYLRTGGTMPIYWHGPSIGTDIGAAGSKVMFLVYRLADPEQMFATFSSLEGSAFLIGGVGFTLMTNGAVQTAPIRSGLGLRLGASVGYIRFTKRPTWNPF